MMVKRNTIKPSKTAKLFVLILAVCYMFSPLQQTLSYSVHNISHAFSTVQAEQHSHDNLMKSKMGRRAMAYHQHNSHSHNLLSFFESLFDGDQSSHQNNTSLETAFDKHFSVEDVIEFNTITVTKTHQFFYNDVLCGNPNNTDSPPPEYFS